MKGDLTAAVVLALLSIPMLPDTRALIILVDRLPVAVKFRVPWHRISYRLGRLPKAPQLSVPAEIAVAEPSTRLSSSTTARSPASSSGSSRSPPDAPLDAPSPSPHGTN